MSVFQYTYQSAWSQAERAFISRVVEFPALVAHGNSRGGSLRALRSVVDSVVKDLMASGKEIPKPLSAKKNNTE